jgi:hypothetical protein
LKGGDFMEEPIKYRNFNLLVVNQQTNTVISYYTSTPVDLIQKLKDSKFEDNKWIVWDKGCLRADAIVGIIEN